MHAVLPFPKCQNSCWYLNPATRVIDLIDRSHSAPARSMCGEKISMVPWLCSCPMHNIFSKCRVRRIDHGACELVVLWHDGTNMPSLVWVRSDSTKPSDGRGRRKRRRLGAGCIQKSVCGEVLASCCDNRSNFFTLTMVRAGRQSSKAKCIKVRQKLSKLGAHENSYVLWCYSQVAVRWLLSISANFSINPQRPEPHNLFFAPPWFAFNKVSKTR